MLILCIVLAICFVVALCAVFLLQGRLSAAREALARQQADFDRINSQAESRFADLAAKVLASNSETLRRQNVNGLNEVLAPMKENIDAFRKSINERYDREARERYALDKRVAELIEINRTVGNEAARLTAALKGNARMQGEWGEMILDNILRTAGFRPGYDYEVQESVTDSEGRRLRPDVVINYGEERKIVIDSKVSIQDYLNMMDATTDSARQTYARAHLASVKKHIGELRTKAYQDAMRGRAFDYVLMFIPNEGAFLSALNLEPHLWETASQSHVLIISPAHLLAVIKLIEQMWRDEKQNRNAIAIADEAGKMLDKFRGFLSDLDGVEKAIRQAGDACSTAMSKLSTGPGNLVTRARKLEELGAKAKRPLPPRYTDPED